MSFSRDQLKAELVRRLLEAEQAVPTSALARLGRTATAALRAGRLGLLRGTSGADGSKVDLDALADLVAQLGELKGMAMKAGQILSYVDLDVPEPLRAALSVLQTHAQPMSFAAVRRMVEAELGSRAAALLREMAPEPIAAASIGQVHRARLGDGTPVAVKIQYPEIARAVAADFGVGTAAARMVARLTGNSTPAAFAAEARDRTLEECDYLHEARMQQRFGTLLAAHPSLVVPGVHAEYCAGKILTTTFVAGMGFDAWLRSDPALEVRNRAGVALFELYVGSVYRFGLFNGDPHPGNYLFLPDGRTAVLDYGCVRELEAATVQGLQALSRALRRDEPTELRTAFERLGMHYGGRAGYDGTRRMLRAFYGPMLVDRVQRMEPTVVGGMRRLLASKRELLGVRLPGELLFLLRIRFGLMSVLARIGAEANWMRLEESFESSDPD